MGLLWRVFAPKPLKKARRAMHPSWVIEDAIVRSVRGSRKRRRQPPRQGRPRAVNTSARAASPRARWLAGSVAAVVVIVLAVVASCTSGQHPAAPAAPAAATAPAPTPTAAPALAPLTLTALVTRQHPFVGTKVGIAVSTTPGARIIAVAHFPAGNLKRTAHAVATGLHTFWYLVGGALLGYRVYVTIRASASGQRRSSRVWFTPRLRPRPPAPKPAPALAHHSGAWCTANAVYNAQYNNYDVYVHSNQPNQSVTATASNGESQSYYTNASGYADVYLYADLGNSVTVTIGAASCSTTA